MSQFKSDVVRLLEKVIKQQFETGYDLAMLDVAYGRGYQLDKHQGEMDEAVNGALTALDKAFVPNEENAS